LRIVGAVVSVEMLALEHTKQPVAPVLATVCSSGSTPRNKRYKTQAGSLGVDVVVPATLPDSVRKLNALNAPTVKAILETLGMHGNNNKRVNTTLLAKHLQTFGAVTLPRVDNEARVESNPFLCGHAHPPVDTHGPVVVRTTDVRASAHVGLKEKWSNSAKTLIN